MTALSPVRAHLQELLVTDLTWAPVRGRTLEGQVNRGGVSTPLPAVGSGSRRSCVAPRMGISNRTRTRAVVHHFVVDLMMVVDLQVGVNWTAVPRLRGEVWVRWLLPLPDRAAKDTAVFELCFSEALPALAACCTICAGEMLMGFHPKIKLRRGSRGPLRQELPVPLITGAASKQFALAGWPGSERQYPSVPGLGTWTYSPPPARCWHPGCR